MADVSARGDEGGGRLPVLIIAGPTASGKTELAVEMARRMGGEIIGADSRQIYQHMDIGTAKPTPDQCRGIPYHLTGFLPPDCRYSAADFAAAARRLIRDIAGRNKLPILAGGTGLYIRAALWGLFEGPERSPSVRQRLRQQADAEGTAALHLQLRTVDPVSADRIAANDYPRIERALEHHLLTGRAISEAQQEHGFKDSPFQLVYATLSRTRPQLYAAINRRVVSMFEQGLIGEVEALLAMGYAPQAPAMTGLGYRTVIGYLNGVYTREAAIEEVAAQTRHYAKRQITWFKKEPVAIALLNDRPGDVLRAALQLQQVWETAFRPLDGRGPSPGDAASRQVKTDNP